MSDPHDRYPYWASNNGLTDHQRPLSLEPDRRPEPDVRATEAKRLGDALNRCIELEGHLRAVDALNRRQETIIGALAREIAALHHTIEETQDA